MNMNTEWNEEPMGEPTLTDEEKAKQLEAMQREAAYRQRLQENALRSQRTRGTGFRPTSPMRLQDIPGLQSKHLHGMADAATRAIASENARRVKIAQDERKRQHERDMLILRLQAEQGG